MGEAVRVDSDWEVVSPRSLALHARKINAREDVRGRCKGDTLEMQGRYMGVAGERHGRCRGDTWDTAGEVQG